MEIPTQMNAMLLNEVKQPLIYSRVPVPVPTSHQILLKVIACGICRTDLHVIDGELPTPKLPLIPGHEIIGMIVKKGNDKLPFKTGELVGVPWVGFTCGVCRYCLRNQENLCEQARFNGYTMDGGYSEYMVAYPEYCFSINPQYANPSGAPLLCAGLIGYRSYKMTGNQNKKIGIYGFGSAAHILIQLIIKEGKEVYVFTREGDLLAQDFAKQLGAIWVGDSFQTPPEKLDAAIVFAPVGSLIPKALQDLDKGGVIVCGGIHMSNIPEFPYRLLWEERSIRSVANLTRIEGIEFLKRAPTVPIKTEVQLFSLSQANEAIQLLRAGRIKGSAVLTMNHN